jgi:hypothetical protein
LGIRRFATNLYGFAGDSEEPGAAQIESDRDNSRKAKRLRRNEVGPADGSIGHGAMLLLVIVAALPIPRIYLRNQV